MPKKFERCVKKIKSENPDVNPYAICRKSTNYYGTTHEKKRYYSKIKR